MQGNYGDKIRLKHILDAIVEIENYIKDNTLDDFVKNSMMRFACIKQMEIIGEASNHLSDNIKTKFSNIQWAQIIGLRNVFVHEYFGIDSRIVWDIIIYDIPELKNKIIAILTTIE